MGKIYGSVEKKLFMEIILLWCNTHDLNQSSTSEKQMIPLVEGKIG
jgi:hypothetical protein